MITIEDSLKEISMLDSSKAVNATEKATIIFFLKKCAYFNESLCKGKLPVCLKLARYHTCFQNGFKNLKNNYRPVSILPAFCNIFEKLYKSNF